jgi:hypothetical protein
MWVPDDAGDARDIEVDLSAQYEAEAWYSQWFQETFPARVSDHLMRCYLNKYGGDVDDRVRNGIEVAGRLLEAGFAAPALVFAASSVEMCMTHLVYEGFVLGAVFQEAWAGRLTVRRLDLDSEKLFKEVSKFLARFGIDLSRVRLPSGELFWETWKDETWPKRKAIVHTIESLEGIEGKASARRGIDCAKTLLDDVAYPVALALGFEVRDGRIAWHDVDLEDPVTGEKSRSNSEGESPFKRDTRRR